MTWPEDGGLTIATTQIYSGIGLVRFKHNLSLKFVEMKMRAQSFLKEKEDEREKWGKFFFCINSWNNFDRIYKVFLTKTCNASLFRPQT